MQHERNNWALTNDERRRRGLPPRGQGVAHKHRYTAATFLARNEKLVKTLLWPPHPDSNPRFNSPAMRAKKAAGHILIIANDLTHETPAAIMDRLGISEIDRARMGEFEATWTLRPGRSAPVEETNPWD